MISKFDYKNSRYITEHLAIHEIKISRYLERIICKKINRIHDTPVFYVVLIYN